MKLTAQQIIIIFLITFILSAINLRLETKDPVLLIWIIVERELMCFFYSLFSTLGMIVGVVIYNRFFKNKQL